MWRAVAAWAVIGIAACAYEPRGDACLACADNAACVEVSGELACVCPAGTVGDGTACGPSYRTIANGSGFTCGVQNDGSLWCWGNNDYSQLGTGDTDHRPTPTRIGDGNDWTAVTAGLLHTCGLRGDGALWCWGYGALGALGDGLLAHTEPVLIGTKTWKAVSAGLYHTCAIDDLGALWCWGYNVHGETGQGSASATAVPGLIGSDHSWRTVDAGGLHTCAVATDDSVACWGLNTSGQCGQSAAASLLLAPTLVPGTGWQSVTTGDYHSCGVRADGVSCWGLNSQGQLGLPPPALRDTPTQVAAGSWNALSAGPGYTCGIAAGVLQCWGDNSAGQLADGSRADRPSGSPVGDRRWKAVFAEQGNHACAQRDDDTTWCWGAGGNGQLGDGLRREALVPVREASSWTQAAVTAESTCFIGPDLTLACRGDDTYGQLGTGDDDDGQATEVLGMVAGGPWVRMTGGRSFVCAIDEAGRLWCWGYGYNGQLGNGAATASTIPVVVDGVRTWSTVAGGAEFACGVDGSGVLSCWGYNVYGQLGNGSTVQANTPVAVAGLPAQVWRAVAAGGYHACAIDQLGLLRCWGYNAYGQVGNGSTIVVPTPAQITTEAWTAVSAGLTHTCGIRPPGTLWCWGSNIRGELGDGGANPTGSLVPVRIGNSEDWLEVAAGQQLTCGVRTGGSLWCWGLGDWGTLGNGGVADADAPTQVGTDTGWNRLVLRHLHACAVRDGTTWCWGQNRSGQLGSPPWRLTPAPVVP